jgi:D-alanyl-D-alanine carboxypeptidase
MSTGFRRVLASGALFFLLLYTHVEVRSQARVSDSAAAAARSSQESIRANVERKLGEFRKADGFPGGTAAVVLPDGTVIAASTGFSDKEAQTPMKPTDRMLAGSIGKTYFAAIVMNLLYEHKLELDGKIEKWIGTEPWFDRIPNARQITIHMLMNHTSGIPEHAEAPDFVAALQKNPDKTWTPVELLAFTFDKPALFPAGKGWSYADTNFILLCYIAEKVTGQPLYGMIEKDILRPLQLNDTIPSTSRTLPGLITGYSMAGSPFGFEGRTIREGKFVVNPQFEWAGGGFVSTSPDLARWAKDLYECKAFPKAMLPVMLESVPARTGPGDRYGLGVQIRQTEFGETYGHGGWFPGYLSEMEYFPEYRVAIAVQINTDGVVHAAGKTHSYIVGIAKEVLGSSVQKASGTDGNAK